jgi:creatinine amidohydrolase
MSAAAGAVLRLGELTWREVEALDRARAVAILPVGAVEAHGPHLPLATDGILAEAMAEGAARRLAGRGLAALLLPTLPYTAAPFAAAFPGTLSLPTAAVAALVAGIGRALAGWGVATLAIANAHLDPAHLASLHAAAAELAAAGGPAVAFPDLTRRPWALRLTAEFRSGACHAGRFEGSVVLAARGDLVRESIRRALPENPASLSRAIRAGLTTFAAAGGPEAYFGAPAAATREEGEATIGVLAEILEDAVMEVIGRGAPSS